jgi:SAM-dependent methyltransferase
MAIKLVKNRFFAIEPYIKGKSVLDIGCVDARPDGQRKYGSTGMHLFLKDHAAYLLGVDIDKKGIEQMAGEGYNVVAGNAESMQLDREFDCIVAGELIEHLSNPGLFLDNMRRHLSDGGSLILTTSNAFGISNFFRISKRNEIKVHAEHTCWYDPKTISQLLLRHSFDVERVFFTNKSKWYRKKYFYKLKYQVPKFIAALRPYFSGVLIVIARKTTSAS